MTDRMTRDEIYMQRCFDLARHGAGSVSPNPLVGAVLVCADRIIGEGYHRSYGGPHAEREALASVQPADRHLIPQSTLYVSLEPCCHYGKTPPCTELILESEIGHVRISARDPNPIVAGKGIKMLRDAGVDVVEGILAAQGAELVRFFKTSMHAARPHVVLKIVQSADGFIGKPDRQVWLSNTYERVMVHKMRSEIDAILVGTNTALLDNPELTTRYYPGRNPLRCVIDRTGKLPETHHVFDGSQQTVIYTGADRTSFGRVEFVRLVFDARVLHALLEDLHRRRIQSLLVEGGAKLMQSFIDQGLWDEAIVVRTPKVLESGIRAPLIEGRLSWRYQIDCDEILRILPD